LDSTTENRQKKRKKKALNGEINNPASLAQSQSKNHPLVPTKKQSAGIVCFDFSRLSWLAWEIQEEITTTIAFID
jgi:hypothetical protein